MKIRYIILLVIAGFAVNLLSGCTKPQSGEREDGDAIWQLTTKAGPHVNQVATFRASLLDVYNGTLRSDGSYSGYYNADGWLTPCRTNDAGEALDSGGNVIAWDAPNWYDLTDKDSQYALRGATKRVYNIGDTHYDREAVSNYTLVLTSPAVRMSSFRPAGSPALSSLHATNPDDYRWGFLMDRKTSTWAISEVDPNLDLNATYLKNPETGYQYTYSCDSTLYEHRSLVTVKVACGALPHASINAVYFTHIMSQAYYMPMWKLLPLQFQPYEEYVFDGDDGSVGYDPLVSYYTENNYPAVAGAPASTTGDKFFVPLADPDVYLVRHPSQTEDFITNNEWTQLTDPSYEWVKGDDTKYVLTPVKDFPILSLDYSKREGDAYKYSAVMPKVVILSGNKGNIKTTVRIAVNLEPMKKYTIWLFVSNVYIQAVFTVSDWTIHTHWSDDPSDPNYNKVTAEETLGGYKTLGTPVIAKSEWNDVDLTDDPDEIESGTVDN